MEIPREEITCGENGEGFTFLIKKKKNENCVWRTWTRRFFFFYIKCKYHENNFENKTRISIRLCAVMSSGVFNYYRFHAVRNVRRRTYTYVIIFFLSLLITTIGKTFLRKRRRFWNIFAVFGSFIPAAPCRENTIIYQRIFYPNTSTDTPYLCTKSRRV